MSLPQPLDRLPLCVSVRDRMLHPRMVIPPAVTLTEAIYKESRRQRRATPAGRDAPPARRQVDYCFHYHRDSSLVPE